MWSWGRHCGLSPQDTSATCRELPPCPYLLLTRTFSTASPSMWLCTTPAPGQTRQFPQLRAKEAEAEAPSPARTAQNCFLTRSPGCDSWPWAEGGRRSAADLGGEAASPGQP